MSYSFAFADLYPCDDYIADYQSKILSVCKSLHWRHSRERSLLDVNSDFVPVLVLSICLSHSLQSHPQLLSSPVCHDVVSLCVWEQGPTGEQVSKVTAVFIGTQVSSGVLGCLDNTFDLRSLVWQPQNIQKHTYTSAHWSYSLHLAHKWATR